MVYAINILLEVIKTTGAILAFAVTVFIVYDRVSRDQPIFALHAEARAAGDNYLFLRIKNVLDEDVVVENWRVSLDLAVLSADTSAEAMTVEWSGEVPMAIVPPRSEFNLPLMIRNLATNRKNETITISADWNTTLKPWVLQRRVKFETTVARLEELKATRLPSLT
jgi:hypothetical protein